MAKEKADTNKQGWLARWRERRAQQTARQRNRESCARCTPKRLGADREARWWLSAKYLGLEKESARRTWYGQVPEASHEVVRGGHCARIIRTCRREISWPSTDPKAQFRGMSIVVERGTSLAGRDIIGVRIRIASGGVWGSRRC